MWVDSYEQLAGEVFGLRAYRITQVVMSVLTLIYCSGFVIVISSSLAAVLPLSRALITLVLIFPVVTLLSWLPFMKDLWCVSPSNHHLPPTVTATPGAITHKPTIHNPQPPQGRLHLRARCVFVGHRGRHRLVLC